VACSVLESDAPPFCDIHNGDVLNTRISFQEIAAAQKGMHRRIRIVAQRIVMRITLLLMISACIAAAQDSTFQDPLLDRMTGEWLMQGIIDGKTTTHDVSIQWVLGHQYIQIREISREKNVKGDAEYEAIVYIGWDKPADQYTCLWLDVTGAGGLNGQAIGHAKRAADRLAFLFRLGEGNIFHTTFVYDTASGIWQWLMDGEENGKLQPFARLKLTKKAGK
jgi:hypothetical protein